MEDAQQQTKRRKINTVKLPIVMKIIDFNPKYSPCVEMK